VKKSANKNQGQPNVGDETTTRRILKEKGSGRSNVAPVGQEHGENNIPDTAIVTHVESPRTNLRRPKTDESMVW
jgi:hypothetical protein